MNSNQFTIVPCSVCPGRVLLKTALIWQDLVFCSPDCIRQHINNVSRLSDTQAVQAIVDDRHLFKADLK
ncbi:MAG: hypothetical protein WAW41_14035 [Methylobacter sp.]